MLSIELQCLQCGWRTICGEAGITRRLRTLGMFRRAPDPPEELVRELLRTHGGRLCCDRCRAANLAIGEGAAIGDAGDWQQAIVCEVCRQAIPDERLHAFPTAKRCVACQDAEDRGQIPGEPDYCPKCGSLVELRVRRGGGVTRYGRFCTGNPPCRL